MKQITKLLFFLLASFATISCDSTEVDGDDTSSEYEGSLVLVPSYTKINAGLNSWVDFTAFIGDKEVTYDETLAIYLRGATGSGVAINDLAYEIVNLGDHTFYAICKVGGQSRLSADITVTGTTTTLDAAYDAEPTNYGPFVKRAMGFQFTYLTCGYCPIAIKAIHDFADGSMADDLVIAAVHVGDELSCDATTYSDLVSLFNISSFPSITIGSLSATNSSTLFSSYLTGMQTNTAMILEVPSLTGISATSELISGVVCVRADVKVSRDGVYGIGAMLVEDDLYGSQSNYMSSDDLDLTGININYHDNVLQAALPSASPFYEMLGDVDSHSANKTYSHTWEFDTTVLSNVKDASACRVIIYIYDKTSYSSDETEYKNRVDNVVQFQVGSGKTYEYEQ